MKIGISDDLAACHALRRAVFIEEQGIAPADEWDDLDEGAVHLLAWHGARPVGTARLLVEGETGKIGRVCVLACARGSGLGAGLIRAGVEALRARPGITQVRLGAQCHAIGFYEKLGFAVCGPVYDDAGIPHQDMVRVL